MRLTLVLCCHTRAECRLLVEVQLVVAHRNEFRVLKHLNDHCGTLERRGLQLDGKRTSGHCHHLLHDRKRHVLPGVCAGPHVRRLAVRVISQRGQVSRESVQVNDTRLHLTEGGDQLAGCLSALRSTHVASPLGCGRVDLVHEVPVKESSAFRGLAEAA